MEPDDLNEIKHYIEFAGQFLGMLVSMERCGHDTIQGHSMYRPDSDTPFFEAVVHWLSTGKGFDEVMELHPTRELILKRFEDINLFCLTPPKQ